mgnify:CR=1 FL=1
MQAHDQVNTLLAAVKSFETRFADALLHQHAYQFMSSSGRPVSAMKGSTAKSASAVGAGASSSEEQRALLSERLHILSTALRSYVSAEGKCVQFLAERVESARVKLAASKKELLAYAALSMKVIISEICIPRSSQCLLLVMRNFDYMHCFFSSST